MPLKLPWYPEILLRSWASEVQVGSWKTPPLGERPPKEVNELKTLEQAEMVKTPNECNDHNKCSEPNEYSEHNECNECNEHNEQDSPVQGKSGVLG